ELERRSTFRSVAREDATSVRLDDVAADGKPHPHSVRLAGEERLEDAFQIAARDTRSCIEHRQFHRAVAGGSTHRDLARSGQPRDRVEGVDEQIHHHLFELYAVAVHLGYVR